jgi:hypothetical protein
VAPQRERNGANSARIAQRLVAEILEIVIEALALDLRERVVGCQARGSQPSPWKIGSVARRIL